MARFDGATYEPQRDQARLSSAMERIFVAMQDGCWWTLEELARVGGCSPAAASARLRDFRKRRFGGHQVERRYLTDGLWEYRLTLRPEQVALTLLGQKRLL